MSNHSPAKKLIDSPLRYLTKSLVRTALTCPRKLVYAANPKLYPRSDSQMTDPFIKHLKAEGQRFGEYCRRLFPHGVEISLHSGSKGENAIANGENSEPDQDRQLMDDLVERTNQMLQQNEAHQRVTVFEGAVRSGSFYIRPDILDKIIHPNASNTNEVELRVIEVKSKSFDSRPSSTRGLMWNTNKKSIKSNYLSYIQDVAFQSLVVRRAFPDYVVSSWLMLPDRGKTWNGDNVPCFTNVPTVDETMQAINGSTAALLNVDELVQVALESKVCLPGSNGEVFKDVVEQWAEQFNSDDLEASFSEIPIGSQCALCKYRPTPGNKEVDENNVTSGFDVCWQTTTGMGSCAIQQPLVIDLYGYTKQSISKFIREKKFALKDLSADDLQSKKGEPVDKISSRQRQWYQVSSLQNESSDQSCISQYVLRRESLQKEMDQWQYPWHFIDFETSSPILPYYSGMAPYEIFAFQFSHHVILENEEHKACHVSEFLHSERGICPNEQFLHALYDAIGTEGTVFQWSTHENSVLTSLLSSKETSAKLSHNEKESLLALLSNGTRPMVDLCKLASDYYYVNGSGGSSSIKRLLAPTINASACLQEIYGAPTYNSSNFVNFQWYQQDERGNAIDPYKILAGSQLKGSGAEEEMSSVTHGGGAATAFHELELGFAGMSEQERKCLEKSLLRYCELDSLSMAMIVQAWQGFLENDR